MTLRPFADIIIICQLLLNFLFKISNRLINVNAVFNILFTIFKHFVYSQGEFYGNRQQNKTTEATAQSFSGRACRQTRDLVFTKGYISQLENDITSPSISTLCDILAALGTDLAEFFRKEDDERVVFGADDFIEKRDDGMTLKWIIPNAQKNMMEPIILELLPGASSAEDFPHDGEEFGYVLEGKIRITLGKKAYVCKRGETFYYKANTTHTVSNAGKTIAKILWVSTPPNF